MSDPEGGAKLYAAKERALAIKSQKAAAAGMDTLPPPPAEENDEAENPGSSWFGALSSPPSSIMKLESFVEPRSWFGGLGGEKLDDDHGGGGSAAARPAPLKKRLSWFGPSAEEAMVEAAERKSQRKRLAEKKAEVARVEAVKRAALAIDEKLEAARIEAEFVAAQATVGEASRVVAEATAEVHKAATEAAEAAEAAAAAQAVAAGLKDTGATMDDAPGATAAAAAGEKEAAANLEADSESAAAAVAEMTAAVEMKANRKAALDKAAAALEAAGERAALTAVSPAVAVKPPEAFSTTSAASFPAAREVAADAEAEAAAKKAARLKLALEKAAMLKASRAKSVLESEAPPPPAAQASPKPPPPVTPPVARKPASPPGAVEAQLKPYAPTVVEQSLATVAQLPGAEAGPVKGPPSPATAEPGVWFFTRRATPPLRAEDRAEDRARDRAQDRTVDHAEDYAEDHAEDRAEDRAQAAAAPLTPPPAPLTSRGVSLGDRRKAVAERRPTDHRLRKEEPRAHAVERPALHDRCSLSHRPATAAPPLTGPVRRSSLGSLPQQGSSRSTPPRQPPPVPAASRRAFHCAHSAPGARPPASSSPRMLTRRPPPVATAGSTAAAASSEPASPSLPASPRSARPASTSSARQAAALRASLARGSHSAPRDLQRRGTTVTDSAAARSTSSGKSGGGGRGFWGSGRASPRPSLLQSSPTTSAASASGLALSPRTLFPRRHASTGGFAGGLRAEASEEEARDERLRASAMRRSELQARARDLLARVAGRRDRDAATAGSLSRVESFREFMEAPTDFAKVRAELLEAFAHAPPAARGAAATAAAWDPEGTLRPMLVRLAFNASATYDKGTGGRKGGGGSGGGGGGGDEELAGRVRSGGSNNSGFGGATMRFAPEREDPQNAGLLQAAELFGAAAASKYPRLSHADLWVLAAYVAVESCGGPVIPFTGGRFDAKSGDRCPFGDALGEAGCSGAPPRNGSRLFQLGCDPAPVTKDAPRGAPRSVREAPTIAHLREVAGRIGLTDREVVVLLLGCGGFKRGRPPPPPPPSPTDGLPAPEAACAGAGWVEEKRSFAADSAALARTWLESHWVEVSGPYSRVCAYERVRPRADFTRLPCAKLDGDLLALLRHVTSAPVLLPGDACDAQSDSRVPPCSRAGRASLREPRRGLRGAGRAVRAGRRAGLPHRGARRARPAGGLRWQ